MQKGCSSHALGSNGACHYSGTKTGLQCSCTGCVFHDEQSVISQHFQATIATTTKRSMRTDRGSTRSSTVASALAKKIRFTQFSHAFHNAFSIYRENAIPLDVVTLVLDISARILLALAFRRAVGADPASTTCLAPVERFFLVEAMKPALRMC